MNSKLSASKRVICGALSLAFLLSPRMVYATTPDEAKQVRQMMLELNSQDAQAASAMAKTLAGYQYKEVVQTLINTSLQQLQSPNLNTYILGASVKSLMSLATKQHQADLRKIVAQIDVAMRSPNPDIAKKAGSLNYIRTDAVQAESSAAYRNDDQLDSLKNYEVAKAAPQTPQTNSQSAQQAQHQQQGQTLKDHLMELMSSSDGEVANAAKVLYLTIADYLSDEIQEHIAKNDQYEIIGRDSETNQVIDILVRQKGKNPVLIGPRGAGKTSIAQKVAMLVSTHQLPDHAVFQDDLGNASVIETSPARISRIAKSDQDNSQAEALEQFFDAVLTLEKKANIKLVVFMDEIHALGKGQIEAMKPYLDSRDKAIRLIGASTAVEYQNAFKSNPAIQRRFQQVGVPEQSISEVKEIVNRSMKAKVEKKYNVQLSDEAIDVVVSNATRVNPDTSRVDGSSKMLDDMAVSQVRMAAGKGQSGTIQIGEKEVYEFMGKKLGYPVNPLDVKGLQKYREDLLTTLNDQVVGQERMVGDVVGQWMMLMKNPNKGVRTILELGPTGVGKSLLGRELVKKVFGSEGAFLEVDANMFKEGGLSNNTFFGAPNGVMSSDQTAGMLFDYLDDPGKGKFGGVILINEAERASTDFWEKMMEIIDTGRGTGGDGKERVMSRHLIILTSNRGDKALYPKTIEDWSDAEYKAHMQSLTEDRLKQVFSESNSGSKQEMKLPDPILARVDKFTAAEPMIPRNVQMMAVQKTKRAVKTAEDTYKIKVDFDSQIISEIVKASYQKGFGARPVEKKIADLVETSIDRALAQGDIVRGEHLKMTLVKNGNQSLIQVQTSHGVVTTEIPKTETQDLLGDNEFLAKMGNLETEMKTRILGQDEMITRIKDAVISHQVSGSQRPLSFFLVGTTGTGKTETAKALAKVLYGGERRVLVLDMGKIIYEGEFNDIFGSPVGHVGSNDERVLEQFLRENPQGGVIVFDEISNMGGKDKAQKEALFKKLYSIFEEGVWISPASNKRYELGKYTIINTGNDLEKHLQGQSADDMRLTIWEQLKGNEKARGMLRQSGVPEAFMGRQADVIVMKPLLKAQMVEVARKMLNEQTKEYTTRGIDIQYSDSFVSDVANTFFTQSQGARSVRNLVEHRVRSLITQMVIQVQGVQNLKGKSIVLSVKDNMQPRTYIKKSDPKREVLLNADLMNGKTKEQSVTVDATEYATKVNLQTKSMLLRTAYHEAGHAVVNDPRVTGQKVALITVIGEDNYLGYARYEEVSGGQQVSTEKSVIVQMAKMLAGGAAERMVGLQESEGSRNDTEQARSLAERFVVTSGLGKGMKAIAVDKDGNPRLSAKQRQQADKEIDRLFEAAEVYADQTMKANWNLVRAVVSELYYRGQITGQRYDQLAKAVAKVEVPTKWDKTEADQRIYRSAVRCENVFK